MTYNWGNTPAIIDHELGVYKEKNTYRTGHLQRNEKSLKFEIKQVIISEWF